MTASGSMITAESRAKLLGHLLRREVVVFVGAGVSLAAGLPNWGDLVKQLGGALPDLAGTDLDKHDTLDVPQWYVEHHGREHLEDLIVREIGDTERQPSGLHRALADLPVSTFFTTNYDELLERALEARGERPDTIVDNRHVALLNDLTATTVVKMHGCVTLPDTIVLAREDYERYAERHPAIITYLQSLLATRTFLFAGFSFADPNFRAIHDAIGRALGQYQRRAYALMRGEPNPLFARHWARRGVDFVSFADGDAINNFVRGLATEAGRQIERGTSLPRLLGTLGRREPPPHFPAAQAIEGHLNEARRELQVLVADASRNLKLQLVSRLPDDARDGRAGREATLEKVRALFGLARGLDQLGYSLDSDDWLRLGNALFQHREWELAVQAYTAAQRHTRERQPWAEGNLARAYLRLRQYARAEAILRRLALVAERGTATWRVNEAWLPQRPADLSELGYVVNRRAEQLRHDGRLDRALVVLDEVRPWLEAGLRLATDAQANTSHQGARENWGRNARPWLLNHIGKTYRLAYEIHVARGDRKEAERLRRQAVDHFVQAIKEDQLLVYPRSHLLDMYEQNLLNRRTAEYRLKMNVDQIERLVIEHPRGGRRLRDSIKARHEDTWARFGPGAAVGENKEQA